MAFHVNVPESNSTVKVSIIDTGVRIHNIKTTVFLHPEIEGHSHFSDCPAWSFLIEHKGQYGQQRNYIFDLSVRKDLENLPTWNRQLIKALNWKVDITKDVADVLVENGRSLDGVDGIIWSHHHWDHTGDPKRFPASTELIVGPGFKANLIPAFPTNEGSGVSEDAWSERTLREITFDGDLRIGGFEAFDFFGDGSFYLLNSPGHAIGHMCALARTTPDTFLFLVGDACHHAGVLRPSELVPLPKDILPHPLEPLHSHRIDTPCPGAIFEAIHPQRSGKEPFYTFPEVPDGKGVNHNRADALKTKDKMVTFDAHENVFMLIAHDPTIIGVVDVFPKSANEWKEKGWKERNRWRFLGDFKNLVEAEGLWNLMDM